MIILLGAGCSQLGGKGSKAPDGGVFKTTDAGKTWATANVVPTAQGIGTLATTNVINMEMDPQDNGVFYLGTRESGVLYSDDIAASWRLPRQVALRDGVVFEVQVDPFDRCTVYIAKGSRLYKTTDCLRTIDDETYVETRAGVNVVRIALDWYTQGTIWIGLSNGDVLKSIDAGKTWKSVLKLGKEVSQILISNKDSRQIIVASYTLGFQRTSDGGDHWEKYDGDTARLTGTQIVYGLVQNKDASVTLATTKYGILRSMDFGLTWEPLKLLTSPSQVIIRAVGISPKDSNTIYYAVNSTFFTSTDSGKTWQTQKFPSTRIPRTMIVDPKDPAVVYVGVAEAAE
ncbi:hypothetical protein HY771_01390 [Candidatus Uhrbacteria bacterium]|nr:hypothetical protein [Candidatus Uhrbacteria bacterium]